MSLSLCGNDGGNRCQEQQLVNAIMLAAETSNQAACALATWRPLA
jgi:hypothetical protein